MMFERMKLHARVWVLRWQHGDQPLERRTAATSSITADEPYSPDTWIPCEHHGAELADLYAAYLQGLAGEALT